MIVDLPLLSAEWYVDDTCRYVVNTYSKYICPIASDRGNNYYSWFRLCIMFDDGHEELTLSVMMWFASNKGGPGQMRATCAVRALRLVYNGRKSGLWEISRPGPSAGLSKGAPNFFKIPRVECFLADPTPSPYHCLHNLAITSIRICRLEVSRKTEEFSRRRAFRSKAQRV